MVASMHHNVLPMIKYCVFRLVSEKGYAAKHFPQIKHARKKYDRT